MTPGVVAETDLAGTTKSEYIFFDGERVARRDGDTGTGGLGRWVLLCAPPLLLKPVNRRFSFLRALGALRG
jgi:hypothetical protein